MDDPEHGPDRPWRRTVRSHRKAIWRSASQWLDLSTGISPFSCLCRSFRRNAGGGCPNRQKPERVCELAMRHYGASVLPLAVPGTQAAIQLLPFLTPNASEVAIVSPTYGEYARAYQRDGCGG
jgi:cobalamin biosynthetic protein CobC